MPKLFKAQHTMRNYSYLLEVTRVTVSKLSTKIPKILIMGIEKVKFHEMDFKNGL
jgi:hypothetical protein